MNGQQYNDTLVGNLRKEIEALQEKVSLLEVNNDALRNDRQRIKDDYARDVENVQTILLDALSADQRDYVDIDILANSIADVFAISLLRTVRVAFTVDVEADVVVPPGFDMSDLAITDVNIEAWNSEVEEFNVQSIDVGNIEEM